MNWITKVPGVSKAMDKAIDSFKSLRRGKNKDRELDEEPKGQPQNTVTQEEKTPATGNNGLQSIKNDPEFLKEVDDQKGVLQQLQLKDTDGEPTTPSPTPSEGNEEGGSGLFRGRVPWNDSYNQELDTSNEPDIGDAGMEDMELEV